MFDGRLMFVCFDGRHFPIAACRAIRHIWVMQRIFPAIAGFGLRGVYFDVFVFHFGSYVLHSNGNISRINMDLVLSSTEVGRKNCSSSFLHRLLSSGSSIFSKNTGSVFALVQRRVPGWRSGSLIALTPNRAGNMIDWF